MFTRTIMVLTASAVLGGAARAEEYSAASAPELSAAAVAAVETENGDELLIIIATVLSAANGIIMPISTVLFGSLVQGLNTKHDAAGVA